MELQEGGMTPVSADTSFQGQVDRYKRDLLIVTLRAHSWSKKDAAQELGLTQRALSHYVSKYDLDSFR
jgi:transcriptional regulator with GAF, ATPase, and Fis domain